MATRRTKPALLLAAVALAATVWWIMASDPVPEAEPVPGTPTPVLTQAPSPPATPAAETGTIAPIRYIPPLSTRDCVTLLDQLRVHLEPVPARVDAAAVDPSLLRLVDSISSYLTTRNALTTSISDYEWVRLGRGRVELTGNDRDIYTYAPPMKGVSVLGFEAEEGDIVIREISVLDGTGEVVAGFQPPKADGTWVVQSGLPRRDLFHLWRRTEVSRIEIRYAPRDAELRSKPRMTIYGGIANHPESGKMAIFLMRQARAALEVGDIATARLRLAEARAHANDFAAHLLRRERARD